VTEAERLAYFRIDRVADFLARAIHIVRIGLKRRFRGRVSKFRGSFDRDQNSSRAISIAGGGGCHPCRGADQHVGTVGGEHDFGGACRQSTRRASTKSTSVREGDVDALEDPLHYWS